MMRHVRRWFQTKPDHQAAEQPEERGAALLEFAIAVPVFIAMLALVFDLSGGFANSRASSTAVRSAARVGALAGEDRNADFLILDALRAEYGDGEELNTIRVYRTLASNTSGAPPVPCNASTGCNEYPGSVLATLDLATDFGSVMRLDNVGDPVRDAQGDLIFDCAPNALDADWCPLYRRFDFDSFLGVQIETTSDATVGLGASEFNIDNQAVFAMYFPPLIDGVVPAPPPPAAP